MMREASRAIYKELKNGRIVNKFEYHDGILQANPLYDELFANLEVYRNQYDLLGFELVEIGESYFVREQGLDRYRDTPALKIQALILILSRHMSEVGTLVEALKDYRAGLSRQSVERIACLDGVSDVMKACGMDGKLCNEIDNNLVSRKIAFWNQIDSLVLTDGGVAIFEQMFKGDDETYA